MKYSNTKICRDMRLVMEIMNQVKVIFVQFKCEATSKMRVKTINMCN